MNEKPRRKIVGAQLVEVSFPVFCLHGQAIEDDRFEDGTPIRTSRLVHIDFVKREAETLNTIYEF